MNLHAVYFSPTKTTKAVIDAISGGMEKEAIIHDITLVKNRQKSLSFNSDDLLILGLPVYAGRIPIMTDEFINDLRGNKTPVVLVAVYGNRHYDDCILEMKDILDKNGFIPIAAGAFIGEHSYNEKVANKRPDTIDITIAKQFGVNIKLMLNSKSLNDITLEVKGNFPYRDRPSPAPVGPTVSDACIKCGKCVNSCPVSALRLEDEVEVDETTCTRCHACIRNCPVKAINFDSRIDHIKTWLETSFSERREPEIFYG